jgi:uncharacterized protein
MAETARPRHAAAMPCRKHKGWKEQQTVASTVVHDCSPLASRPARRVFADSFAAVLVATAVALAGCSSGGSTTGHDAKTPPAGSGPSSVGPTSTNVSFNAAGTTTYGTLEVPAHKKGQKLAAALLLAGSGPTDRNGNDTSLGVSADTLGLVAGILASEGIMSLRYDKYFAGQTGGGRYASNPGAITLNAYLRQAVAGYDFLHDQPDADPSRMLIVGHSEGGMYALVLAHYVSPRPAGLALLEPQDIPILSLVELQAFEHIDAFVAAGQMTRSEAVTNARLVQTAIADFRAGRKVSTAGMAPSVIPMIGPEILSPDNLRYIRQDDAIVPADWAARLPSSTRVLMTDGTRDSNIPPTTIGPLVDALRRAGVAGPGFKLLQGTDHYMHLASQPDTQAVLAPAAVSAIRAWAQAFPS